MNAFLRLALTIMALALGAATVYVLVDRATFAERAAQRRSLLARDLELTRSTHIPGSALACLDGNAGEAVENACEHKVFASPEGVAAAVGYMDARLTLLAQAAAMHDAALNSLFASIRRAVALDRFGIAAHVLAERDGCTANKCDAFNLVDDASALKANLRAQVYDQYVSRYAGGWNKASEAPAQAAAPAPSVSATPPLTTSGQKPVAAIKPGEHWDFPSAASIPPVSIMNSEPPLPKGAEAQAKSEGAAKPATEAKAPAKTPLPSAPPAATR